MTILTSSSHRHVYLFVGQDGSCSTADADTLNDAVAAGTLTEDTMSLLSGACTDCFRAHNYDKERWLAAHPNADHAGLVAMYLSFCGSSGGAQPALDPTCASVVCPATGYPDYRCNISPQLGTGGCGHQDGCGCGDGEGCCRCGGNRDVSYDLACFDAAELARLTHDYDYFHSGR